MCSALPPATPLHPGTRYKIARKMLAARELSFADALAAKAGVKASLKSFQKALRKGATKTAIKAAVRRGMTKQAIKDALKDKAAEERKRDSSPRRLLLLS